MMAGQPTKDDRIGRELRQQEGAGNSAIRYATSAAFRGSAGWGDSIGVGSARATFREGLRPLGAERPLPKLQFVSSTITPQHDEIHRGVYSNHRLILLSIDE
jgi:hypothetical protein